jgi:hypothetical protein
MGSAGRVGTGPKRVRSSMGFFEIFLPAPVLDPSVLMGHGFDGLDHESGRIGSRPRVQRVRSRPQIQRVGSRPQIQRVGSTIL